MISGYLREIRKQIEVKMSEGRLEKKVKEKKGSDKLVMKEELNETM